MTKRLKKMICALGMAGCILGSAYSVYAIEFTVTPPYDPFSYAVKKEDNEQKAYVTATSFSKSGTLYAYSQQCDDNSICTSTMNITPYNRAATAGYKKHADADLLYEMYSYSNISGMNVQGRYTP